MKRWSMTVLIEASDREDADDVRQAMLHAAEARGGIISNRTSASELMTEAEVR